MNWRYLRYCPGLDRRADFLWRTPPGGRHLDLGASTGGTLRHFLELRADLQFWAVDLEDYGHQMPPGVSFHRLDLTHEPLPFPDAFYDSVTMMHVAEHLPTPGKAPGEIARVLKPGGRLYIEGPGPRSLWFPSSTRCITLNFFDDPTHLAPLSRGRIARVYGVGGLQVRRSGVARAWWLVLGMPLSLLRRDWHHFLAGLIHLGGWNVYVEFQKLKEAHGT